MNECWDRFGGLVWSLARRLSPNAADAEDAVQEIFIDLWRSAARYDPAIAGETTFVATVARRRLIDGSRRRSRRPSAAPLPAELDAAPAVNMIEVKEQAASAQRAFEQLRPEQQQVLELAIHSDFSHEEIASTTGLPLGTVKTHARRGLIKLRELLKEESHHDRESHRAVRAGR